MMRFAAVVLSFLILSCTDDRRSYYLNTNGDDQHDGTVEHPFRSIQKLNTITLLPGDSVLFAGGQVFAGEIVLDSLDTGNESRDVAISSYGKGKSTVLAGDGRGIYLNKTHNVFIGNIAIRGNGRKDGNTTDGIEVYASSNIVLDSLVIRGFQKAGLVIHQSSNVTVNRVHASENGFAGIFVDGVDDKEHCKDIRITNCLAENNPGDPTNFKNHSGNGIVAAMCRNVLIEHCIATNNGWDMPRVGNGPVGIWAYEADSLTIQSCLSYRNRTSKGGDDGGGFDLDGGVTNSVIEYCISFENEGGGYGLFQYAYGSPWKGNTIRFNISVNDGKVSAAHAGIYVWNSSDVAADLTNGKVHNNIIYNDSGAAIHYSVTSMHMNFSYFNNLFVCDRPMIIGITDGDEFYNNFWQHPSGIPLLIY